MTALNQPERRQETWSGSPLREPDENLVSLNMKTLCHQQQEEQNEQDFAEDSCTVGSTVRPQAGVMRYDSVCRRVGCDKRICHICAQPSVIRQQHIVFSHLDTFFPATHLTHRCKQESCFVCSTTSIIMHRHACRIPAFMSSEHQNMPKA